MFLHGFVPLFGMAKEGHEHQSHPGPVGSINLGISVTCGNHGMSTLDIARSISFGGYPLVNCPITMENHHVSWENLTISMAMFNCYVKLPEGTHKQDVRLLFRTLMKQT